MKKTWIKLKRGLLEPKHRIKMGECIWLYLHIIDRAHWGKGAVLEWKDAAEAELLNMPVRTLRHQRKKLEDEKYIIAEKSQRHQKIIIVNWTNPRRYDGEVQNVVPEGDNPLPPTDDDEIQSPNQSDNQSSSPVATPSIKDSQNHISQDENIPSLSYDQLPWKEVLSTIRGDHYQGNKSGWENSPWVQTWVVAGSDGHMVIGCTTEDDAAWLVDRGSAVARHALTGVLGRQVDVEFLGPAALQEVMADAA